MAKVLDLARKRGTTFVELSYGAAPTYVRYTDADSDTTFEGNVYSSVPSMEIKLPPYTGMLIEKPLKVTLPKDSFLDAMSNGQAHTAVQIRVVLSLESDTPGVPVDDIQELFRGSVSITVRNAGGKLDQIVLKCVNWKHEADRPAGFQANAQCYWQFQGRGCVVDSPPGSGAYISAVTPLVPAVKLVLVASVLNHSLTLTGSPAGGPFVDLIFHRGFFEENRLQIGIREWDPAADDKLFILERPAPDSWVGKVVALHQGCDKSLLTCQNRYSNDEFFGGIGAAIRDYNPLYEIRD